jgi:hypothetical protein
MVLKVTVNIFAVPEHQSIKVYEVVHSGETWARQDGEVSDWLSEWVSEWSSILSTWVHAKLGL